MVHHHTRTTHCRELTAISRPTADPLHDLTQRALSFNAGQEDPEFGRAFCLAALNSFWTGRCQAKGHHLYPPQSPFTTSSLDKPAHTHAQAVGGATAKLSLDVGAYTLSSLYVQTLPDVLRTQYGMYFTPPPVVDRLLDMVTLCGFDWGNGHVVDPACGGGAFLTPVARRMLKHALTAEPNADRQSLAHGVCQRLRGIEIEPFCAWMAKVFLQLTLIESMGTPLGELPDVVDTADTMELDRGVTSRSDLVIGNPPYGRVTLPRALRQKYARSLFGHANLYGIFTDLAVRMARPNGLIAYVTPTSFLGGQYFRNLRKLLREQAPPRAVDFIAHRRGVFQDVLQETSLAVYKKGRRCARVSVHLTTPTGLNSPAEVSSVGKFKLTGALDDPWVLPRNSAHAALLRKAEKMKLHLTDLGYEVSTGPLVWNRHKEQLADKPGRGTLPLIWAESIQAGGKFRFAHEKRNHVPYFHVLPGQHHLVTHAACVLVQRTTAKEQHRRVIAAQLPSTFLRTHGGAVIENHLNVVRPANGHPLLDLDSLALLLNSRAIDELFRCISGSVAVSAYEIQSMPLPSADDLAVLQELVTGQASADRIHHFISTLYGLAE